ncbi:MAG: matrixin family metalloprotease, partial [Phycisphaerae bacterium]
EGGEVDVPNVGTFEFEPLSAERLGFEAEQSGQLRELIEATVEENFAGYGVVAVSTDETLPHGAYSIIHFGGFDPKLFGISENIDYYNRDKTDEAIVFAESFVGVFGLEPTLEQMATALGNIAAHEGGHLLGLNHTADAASLMDSASPPDSFIGDQEFIWTDLAEQIFPIGTQDAPLLLSETVGPGQ